MAKKNCWELKKCGREIGGIKSQEFGVCNAATEKRLNGANGGIMGGRSCWVIAGTLCGGKPQGSFALKFANCKECDFYKSVANEEGNNFIKSMDLLNKLNS